MVTGGPLKLHGYFFASNSYPGALAFMGELVGYHEHII